MPRHIKKHTTNMQSASIDFSYIQASDPAHFISDLCSRINFVMLAYHTQMNQDDWQAGAHSSSLRPGINCVFAHMCCISYQVTQQRKFVGISNNTRKQVKPYHMLTNTHTQSSFSQSAVSKDYVISLSLLLSKPLRITVSVSSFSRLILLAFKKL